MASERQIAANKRNAAKSTGPRTTDGKTRSRANALRHGSFSALKLEQQFIACHLNQQLAAKLHVALQPVNRLRLDLLAALEVALLGSKSTETKTLLRKLQSLERRERAVVRKVASRSAANDSED